MDNLTGRLKRVAGRQTLRLTHQGRRTGKPYQVTIWFVAGPNGTVYLGTANANRQWVSNVKKTPQVKLDIGGELFEGEARFLDGRADHDRVMSMILRKYWMFSPLMFFGQALTRLGVMKDTTGAFEVKLSTAGW